MNNTAMQEMYRSKVISFQEAAVSTRDDDDPRAGEFRRLTSGNRDLPAMTFDKAQKLSFKTWQRNPLGATIIALIVGFSTYSLQVKVKIKKRDPEGDIDTKKQDAHKLWQDFWEDPVNKMESTIKLFAQSLFLDGELPAPVVTALKKSEDGTQQGNGKVRIGYMDPNGIKEIKTNPKNQLILTDLVFSPPEGAQEEITMKVINVDIDPTSPTYNKRIGDIFFWRINYVINQKRGHGELVVLLDWLDALDQFLFDALEGFRMRNAFFYWMKMTGANQATIDEMQKKIKTPKPSQVRVTNEKVEWDVVTPELKSVEVDQALKTFLAFIVGVGKNMPVHWFGSGDDANLATAKVMGVPAMMRLKGAQTSVRDMIKDMVYFVCDQAVLAKTLKLSEDEYVECDITMFDFEKADSAVIASAFAQIVTGLTVSVDKGWVTDDTAKKLCDGFVSRMGVEVDPDEQMKDEIETDPDLDGLKDIYAQADKGTADSIGRLPLAIQQLSLAQARAEDAGDTRLAKKLSDKIDELLKRI